MNSNWLRGFCSKLSWNGVTYCISTMNQSHQRTLGTIIRNGTESLCIVRVRWSSATDIHYLSMGMMSSALLSILFETASLKMQWIEALLKLNKSSSWIREFYCFSYSTSESFDTVVVITLKVMSDKVNFQIYIILHLIRSWHLLGLEAQVFFLGYAYIYIAKSKKIVRLSYRWMAVRSGDTIVSPCSCNLITALRTLNRTPAHTIAKQTIWIGMQRL